MNVLGHCRCRRRRPCKTEDVDHLQRLCIIIEHIRNSEKLLTLQGEGLELKRQTTRVD